MRRSLGKSIALYVGVAIVCLIIAFPVYWMVNQSIQSESVFRYPPLLVPKGVTFQSYVDVIQGRPVLPWFRNTLLVALATAFLTLVGSVSAGYSLSRFRTKTNTFTGIAVLATQMLPATLLVIPIYVIFKNFGLLDSLVGLTLSNIAFSLPLGIWMMKGFFDSIPVEIDEAGLIDGCSRVRVITDLMLPVSLPGLVTVLTSSFLLAWDEYFMARTLISSESKWVLSVGLSSFIGEYSIQWDEMLAAAVIFCIPPLLLFTFGQKYLIRGLTSGSVKG